MIRLNSFNPILQLTDPQTSGIICKALRVTVPQRLANVFKGMVLILCVLVLLSFVSACVANRSPAQQETADAHASPDSLANFPQELFGVWVADDPNYIEPSGWDDWYRNIEIGYCWDDGLGIQYGSLVGGKVLDVKYDGETCIVEVYTEFDEYASYYFRLQGDKLQVKAPGIMFNEPDEYKAYHRFIDEWPEE